MPGFQIKSRFQREFRDLFENIFNKIINRNKIKQQRDANLRKVNQHIESIFEKCSTNGTKEEEIASTGLRILSPSIYESKRKKILSLLFKIIILCLLLSSFKRIEPLNRLSAKFGRLLLFRVEPYWDWNKWYYSSCLMNNPYYKPKPLRESDCYSCEDITEIERITDLFESDIISEKNIKNNIPVIIGSEIMKRELKNWSIASHKFGVKNIEKIYEENDWKYICMFRTNIKSNDHLTLLKKVSTKQYSQIGWYAHWENCDKKTEKQLRRYYNRPDMLPPMLELTKANWILVSNNFIGTKFKMIDPSPGTQVLLIIQIKGQNRLRLEPKEYCASRGCAPLEDTLQQNEMMLMSAKLWNLSYTPNNTGFNLAIIIGAIYA